MLIGDDFAKSEESGGYFWGGDLSERVSEGTVSFIKSRVLDANSCIPVASAAIFFFWSFLCFFFVFFFSIGS